MGLRSLTAVLCMLSPLAGHAQEAEPQALLDRFLDERGAALEACLADAPELLGPKGVETASAESGSRLMRRLMIAVDGSGSMAGRFGADTKMSAARLAALSFLSRVPPDVEVGLIGFGHRGDNTSAGKEESCAGVEALVPLGAGTRPAVNEALGTIVPTGWTPLADALATAERALSDSASGAPGERVVYVVSDGKETCGGDPIATARAIHEGDTNAIVNVIGFDLAEEDRAQLAAVAEAGGGTFEDIRAVDAEAALARLRASVGNRKEGTAAAIANARSQIGNTVRTAQASGGMTACINQAVGAESTAFSAFRRDIADPALARETAALLRERHRAYRDAARGRSEALDALRREANERIDAQNRDNESRIDAEASEGAR